MGTGHGKKKVAQIREKEKKMIFRAYLFQGLAEAVSMMTTSIFSLACFLTYTLIYKRDLSISQTFTLVSLFNSTIEPMRWFIRTLNLYKATKVSFKRIEKLMMLDEYEKLEDSLEMKKGELFVENAVFCWDCVKVEKVFEIKKKK